jgi:hypothetical protein
MKDSTVGKPGRPPVSQRVIRVGGAVRLPLLRERSIEVEALVARVAFRWPHSTIWTVNHHSAVTGTFGTWTY